MTESLSMAQRVVAQYRGDSRLFGEPALILKASISGGNQRLSLTIRLSDVVRLARGAANPQDFMAQLIKFSGEIAHKKERGFPKTGISGTVDITTEQGRPVPISDFFLSVKNPESELEGVEYLGRQVEVIAASPAVAHPAVDEWAVVTYEDFKRFNNPTKV